MRCLKIATHNIQIFLIIEVNTDKDTTTETRKQNLWIHQLHSLERDGINEKKRKKIQEGKRIINQTPSSFLLFVKLVNGRCKFQTHILLLNKQFKTSSNL